ncbi:MAG TPA: hypothetical protein ENK57_17415 [Polyangiaceae bacterium]|nr:hypothetical protein [Polyangiaceae bacterium]
MGMALLLALGATAASDDAAACGNGVERRLHEHVMAIAKAERDVDAGKPRLAAKHVLNRYPQIRSQAIGRNGVADRALRVMARAVVRTGGGIDGGTRFPGSTDAECKENLNWALRVLHGFVNHNPVDAGAKADYGEALARVPERHVEARRVLSELAAKDLIGSAHAYAALAGLRRQAGEGKLPFIAAPQRVLESARAKLAEARCRRMAVDDETVCAGRSVEPQT